MNRKQVGITLALLLLSAAGVVQAVSPTGTTAPTPENPVNPAVTADGPAPPTTPASRLEAPVLTPMHREIQDFVTREQAEVEALNLRFARAVPVAEKVAIQKEIEALKQAGMIAVLDIQLRYAESGGHVETAAQLRSSIEALRNPKIPVATIPTGR